jgi:P4 family phage/plasmid primase-like protien
MPKELPTEDIKMKNNQFKKYCKTDTSMEAELHAFMAHHVVNRTEPFTHTSMHPSGRYYVDNKYLEGFWTRYCNYIRKNPPTKLTITEKPAQYTPYRVDFDFKTSLDDGAERFYEKDIEKIIKKLQDEIRNMVDDDEFEDKILWCILLEKPKPRTENGIVKDGFHLHFPHFVCERWVYDYLRGKLLQWIAEEKIWSHINFLEKVDKVIDVNVPSLPWLIYGSAKDKNAIPYTWSRVYDDELEDREDFEVFEDEYNKLKEMGKTASATYYLPRFMSIRRFNTHIKLKDEVVKKKVTFAVKKTAVLSVKRVKTEEQVLADIKIIKEGHLMEMLSDERADDYYTWVEVGITLFDITEGREDGLDMWIEFSRRSSKFKDGECEKRWSKMTMHNRTISSIMFMARNDNPTQYKQWREDNIKYLLRQCLMEEKPNEYDIAKVVHKMYETRFVFTTLPPKIEEWYEFKNHHYFQMNDGCTDLRKLLPTEVRGQFFELRNDLETERHNLRTQLNREQRDEGEMRPEETKQMLRLNQHIKRVIKILTSLKTDTFHNAVIKMCKLLFKNDDFHKRVDENKMLLCCENGVIDLEMGIFRDGRPDDYITYCTNKRFKTYTEDDDEFKFFEEYFKKVLPNENRRNYFFDFVSLGMRGGNINKKFLAQTGIGDNGKSITMMILEDTFGEYVIKFPREMFIKGRANSSASARPELARVRGRRFAICQEIAETEEINIGVLKELTGNDSFFVRTLYDKGFDLRPMFTLMMQCNKLPKIPGQDPATWNRVRVLEYESKFTNDPPADIDEQFRTKHFLKDPEFANNIPVLSSVLLWYLFERFKRMKSKMLREPQEVIASTSEYRSECDIYMQFINDHIERVENPEEASKAFIRLADVYSEFKEWYKLNHPSYAREMIGKNTMKNELNKKLGHIKNIDKKPKENDCWGFGFGNRWYGYKMIEDEDDGNKEEESAMRKLMAKKETK